MSISVHSVNCASVLSCVLFPGCEAHFQSAFPAMLSYHLACFKTHGDESSLAIRINFVPDTANDDGNQVQGKEKECCAHACRQQSRGWKQPFHCILLSTSHTDSAGSCSSHTRFSSIPCLSFSSLTSRCPSSTGQADDSEYGQEVQLILPLVPVTCRKERARTRCHSRIE